MKKILIYTKDELDQFTNIYNFLNHISRAIDDECELTDEREHLIDEAILAVQKVENMLDD